MPANPELGKWRQEGQKFKTILGNISNLRSASKEETLPSNYKRLPFAFDVWVLLFNFLPVLNPLGYNKRGFHIGQPHRPGLQSWEKKLLPSPQHSKRVRQDAWWVHARIPKLTSAASVGGQVAAVGICNGGGARRAEDLGIARPRPRPRAARRGLSFPV